MCSCTSSSSSLLPPPPTIAAAKAAITGGTAGGGRCTSRCSLSRARRRCLRRPPRPSSRSCPTRRLLSRLWWPTPRAAGVGDVHAGGDPSSSSLPNPTAPANMSSLALPVPRSAPAPLRAFLSSHRLLLSNPHPNPKATAPLPAALPSPTAPSRPSPSWRSTCTSGRQQGQHAVGPSFPGSSPSATKRKR